MSAKVDTRLLERVWGEREVYRFRLGRWAEAMAMFEDLLDEGFSPILSDDALSISLPAASVPHLKALVEAAPHDWALTPGAGEGPCW